MVSKTLATVPEDLVDYLESGVSILVGTRDARNIPEVARGVGAAVSKDRTKVTVYLTEAWSEVPLANLAGNGEIAVGFSRPLDNFAIQLKGRVTAIVRSASADRSVVDRYHNVYGEQLYMTGLPRSITRRLAFWPAAAVTFEVRDLFLQTPGPDAGKRYGEVKPA